MYLLGVGLALVGLALGVTDWALSLRPGVTEANFRRIRPGMRLSEAEAILGGPPQCDVPPEPTGEVCWPWRGEEGRVYIAFSRNGARVVEASWHPATSAKPGSLARLRAWLGW